MARLGRDDVRCLIVGSDQGRAGYRRELEDLIAKRQLEGVVHLVGDCTDMPAALMLADTVIHASTDPEGFGRVIVEAQAMGRPIVATDHGASRELILPNETGWLVPPDDPAALADAINTALALNEADRKALASNAITRVHKAFTKQIMCTSTMDVYREVLTEAEVDGVVAE